MQPGRHCPLHYRYAPAALAADTASVTDCVYVIGGLYGNRPALDALFVLAAAEPAPPLLVFNGDFNWFNIDDEGFDEINRRVLAHLALRGNVETEIAGDDAAAGCGCAYPAFVGDDEVARSNRIIARLRETSRHAPAVRAALAALPMHCAVKVGGVRVAAVHGDCESLAGWGLSQEALAGTAAAARVRGWLEAAGADVIASSHSCLPVMQDFACARGTGIVVNNGAAGMPNFRGDLRGVITRIATTPARQVQPCYAAVVGGVHVEALPLAYDSAGWLRAFLANWPAGSPAHDAYHARIVHGPHYTPGAADRIGANHARPLRPAVPAQEQDFA